MSSIRIARSNRPPSSHFDDPKDVISNILDGLKHPHDPAPYFGYEILYAASTTRWRGVLRKSVGAPPSSSSSTTTNIAEEEDDDDDVGLVYRALGTSMERRGNQFRMLVRSKMDANFNFEHSSHSSSHSRSANDDDDGRYVIEFPQEALDYYDGSA